MGRGKDPRLLFKTVANYWVRGGLAVFILEKVRVVTAVVTVKTVGIGAGT